MSRETSKITVRTEAFYTSHDCPKCPTRGYGLHEEDGETGVECRPPDPQGWS